MSGTRRTPALRLAVEFTGADLQPIRETMQMSTASLPDDVRLIEADAAPWPLMEALFTDVQDMGAPSWQS